MKICVKCGAEVEDENKFCTSCGMPIKAENDSMSVESQPPETAPEAAPETAPEAAPETAPETAPQQYRTNPPLYYQAEFTRIKAGKAAKFNWAAFFSAPMHQLYYGRITRFYKTFLPYTFFSIALLVMFILIFSAQDVSEHERLEVVGILCLLAAVLLICGLVLCILNGAQANMELYAQTQGDARKLPKNKDKALNYFGIVGVIGIIIFVMMMGSMMHVAQTKVESTGTSSKLEKAKADTSATASIVSSTAAQPTTSMSQMPTADTQAFSLRALAQMSIDTDEVWYFTGCYYDEKDMGGDYLVFYHLLAESRYSIGNVLSKIFGSYAYEDTFTEDAGPHHFTVRAGNAQQSMVFDLTAGENTAQLSPLTIQDKEGTLELSLGQSAAVWKGLYDAYLDSQGVSGYQSLAKDIQGTWSNDGGKTMLVITKENYDKANYEYAGGFNKKMKIIIFRATGSIDERFLAVSDDKNELYIYTDPDWYDNKSGLLKTYIRVQ